MFGWFYHCTIAPAKMNLQILNYCTIFQTEYVDLLGGRQIGCMLAEDACRSQISGDQSSLSLADKEAQSHAHIHRASNHLSLQNPEQGHAGQENKTTCCCIAGLQRVILIVIILWPVGAIGLWG